MYAVKSRQRGISCGSCVQLVRRTGWTAYLATVRIPNVLLPLSISLVLLLSFCGLVNRTYAGNPLFFNETTGAPFVWPDNRAVYIVETGPIGTLSNAEAVQVVDRAFQRWASLPSVNLRADNLDTIQPPLPPEVLAPFKTDFTISDFSTLETCPALPNDPPDIQRTHLDCIEKQACVALGGVNCPSPIVFDNDGQIIASIFGPDNVVLGVSGPDLFRSSLNQIVAGSSVINGIFFTAEAEKRRQAQSGDPNDTNALFLEGVLVHEFGHFLGLGHSVVNGDTALLNPAVRNLGGGSVDCRQTPQGCLTSLTSNQLTFGPLDGLVAVGTENIETMYPTSLSDTTGTQNTPELDDESALAKLYPCLQKVNENGRCSRLQTENGTIAGRVFIPDPANPGQFKLAQGVLVIARRFDPDNPNASLTDAESQITGNTFAPKRCRGEVFLDSNQNGQKDGDEVSFTGLFGACTRSDDPVNAGQQECQTLLNDKFLGPGYRFSGFCGFFGLGFGSPRTIGQDPNENNFELTDLAPGKYLVQAVPLFQGGFSSPVRSTTGFIPGITPDLSSLGPVVLTDDNEALAFFPNPQTGEFYNGPANGCGADISSCGAEKGDPTDDPFAYTQIEVRAGGRTENINIVMNTSERNFNGDPGFAFCRIGDVNNDNIVNRTDIREVLKQQARSDKGDTFNQRADLNQDGQVTFSDVDLITDIVTLPRPIEFDSNALQPTSQELKRGIATFDAICRAAARDGCAIEAPANDIQENGKARDATCTRAKELGCRVTDCP